MWRPGPASQRPVGGPRVPPGGGFIFHNFTRPPPGPPGPFRPLVGDLGHGEGPLVPSGVDNGQKLRQPYPPPRHPMAAFPGGPGGPPYRPPHELSAAPPGIGNEQPRPPSHDPSVIPPGVAGVRPTPPPRDPAVPHGVAGMRPTHPLRGPVVPHSLAGVLPTLPPREPAVVPVTAARDSGGGHWRPAGEPGGGSSTDSTATELWLADWFERSGVAQRCLKDAEEKKTAKSVNLSTLQALPAAELARPEVAAQLRRLVAQRRRRRQAVRRRRQAERQRVQRRHAEIDAWRADIRQQAARQQEAEDMKREADKVLGEVRRKISDVEKHLETLEELRTLREVRDLKARSAGLFSSAASDQRFADVTARLTELLDRHLVTYEAELRALQAMTAAPPPPPASQTGGAAQLRVLKALFGSRGVSAAAAAAAAAGGKNEESDHLVHMVDWEADPQTLLNIRSDWDRCLVAPEDPLGSSVPPTWVVPAPPSSDLWASCLLE